MAKKSVIIREKKRRNLYSKYKEKRSFLIKEFKKTNTFKDKLNIQAKIQKLPRDSSKTRQKNRCWRTGRSKAVFRDFGLCRHMLREMALQGLLPGLIKSSW